MNQRLLYAIVIVSVIVALMSIRGMFNPYKKAFLQQLEEQRRESEARILKLQAHSDSLELVNVALRAQADSLKLQINNEATKRKKAKNEYDKKIAELGKRSTAELPSYFTERYNR